MAVATLFAMQQRLTTRTYAQVAVRLLMPVAASDDCALVKVYSSTVLSDGEGDGCWRRRCCCCRSWIEQTVSKVRVGMEEIIAAAAATTGGDDCERRAMKEHFRCSFQLIRLPAIGKTV